MRKDKIVLVRIVLFLLLVAVPSWGAMNRDVPPHLDKQKLRYGCGSCHIGFNFKSGGGIRGCTSCHGTTSSSVRKMMDPGTELKDVEAVFKKPNRHPVYETAGVHSAKETLPETDPKAPRHVDCVDCHNPHLVTTQNVFAGVKGKKTGDSFKTDVTNDYVLCYNCHGESANLPGRYSNKRSEFNLNNPSFHPVEGEGKNGAVISLIKPYREKKVNPADISIIRCCDCHGNDDASGPRGPHGSTFAGLLVENFSTRDNEVETAFSYALCYRCHSRTSILNNESFKHHAVHISGKNLSGLGRGTSCHTCHSSHGSSENRALIKFNEEIVSSSSSGQLKFVSKGAVGTSHGECYLTCHGVDHNPKGY